MKRLNLILGILLVAASLFAIRSWRNAQRAQEELRALQAEKDELIQNQRASALEQAQTRLADQSDPEHRELLRLRGEANQLRAAATNAQKLQAENQQLRSENQRLRDNAASAASTSSSPGGKDPFARANWAFSGYATPDAALVSAISAMKDGNPKAYLESLSPEEQARMSKVWENKSEAEIAAKHQSDVAAISGMQILDRKTISPDEVQMNVYIQGVNRFEKVIMKQVDGQWKFGGFSPDPKK